MARSSPPKYAGVVKIDEKASGTWLHIVWGLDSDHIRLEVRKATSVELKAIEQGSLTTVSISKAMELLA